MNLTARDCKKCIRIINRICRCLNLPMKLVIMIEDGFLDIKDLELYAEGLNPNDLIQIEKSLNGGRITVS